MTLGKIIENFFKQNRMVKFLSWNGLYIIAIVCVWLPILGTNIANLEEISNELLLTSIVTSAYVSFLWCRLTERKCYTPRSLNFGLFISCIVFVAVTINAKEWWGQLTCVLAVTSFVLLLINFHVWLKTRKDYECIYVEPFLVRDTPSTKDDYQRSSIVNTIVRSVLLDADKANFAPQDGSFVFNINEPYGTGKSSCMEVLRDTLTSKNILYFDFLPWKSKSTSNLVDDFFAELKSTLAPYIYVKEKWYMTQYARLIIKNASELGLDNWLPYNNGVNSQYVKLRDVLIKTIKRPIVIIVDDVDRLQSDELRGLLNLVRNVANFPYLYFVMNADAEYIEAMLATDKFTRQNVCDYLKKIINVQILFPKVERCLLVNDFNERLLDAYKLCSGQNVSDKNEGNGFLTASQLFKESQNGEILFDNFREVKRFFNSLNFSIMANLNASQNDKFLFGDYVKLELIKYFAPEIYRILRSRPTELLDGKSNGRFVLKKECKEIVSRKLSKEIDDLIENRKDKNSTESETPKEGCPQAIDDVITPRTEVTMDFVYDMLSSLFYDEVNFQDEKSIRFLDSYDMYFSNHQLPTYMSVAKFLSIFYKRDPEAKDQIKLDNIESFYQNIRIMLQNNRDISDVKLFIESICYWVEYGAMLSMNDTERYISKFTKIEWEFSREIKYVWIFFYNKDKEYARTNTDILLDFLKEKGMLYSKMALVGQLFPLHERLVFDDNDRKKIVESLSKHVIARLNDFRQDDKNNCYDVVKYMWELDRYQVWEKMFVSYLKSNNYNDWLFDCISYSQENGCCEINKNNIERIFNNNQMIIKKLDSTPNSLAYLLVHEDKLREADETKYPFLGKVKK